MEGIAQVEQCVRPGEAVFKLELGQTVGFHRRQLVRVAGRVLVEQAKVVRQAVLREVRLEGLDARPILARVLGSGQQFEPDEVQPEALQGQGPL